MEDKKIKVGFYLNDKSKENLDAIRKLGIKPNDLLDSILSFEDEGLIKFVNLIKQFKNNKEFTVSTDDIYCTTEVNSLRKADLEKYISLERLQKITIESNLKSNLTEDDIKSNISIIFKHLVDVTKAILVIGKDGNNNKDEIKELKLKIEKLEEKITK